MKLIFSDERTDHINGLASFFCLVLTQLALVSVIVYKRYFLGLPYEANLLDCRLFDGRLLGDPAERWYEMLYSLIGVAVALGFYSLVACLGKRQLEQIAVD